MKLKGEVGYYGGGERNAKLEINFRSKRKEEEKEDGSNIVKKVLT